MTVKGNETALYFFMHVNTSQADYFIFPNGLFPHWDLFTSVLPYSKKKLLLL